MGLVIKNLVFSYKNTDKKILDNFSAEFPSDKITALLGGNGAGKTTLANLIMGILKPVSGEILLDGENIVACTLAERGMKIGRRMQAPRDMSMRANKIMHEKMGAQEKCGLGISSGYMIDPVKSSAVLYVLDK